MSQPQELTPQEKLRVEEGHKLQVLKESEGWQVVEKWLKDRAYHSWANPRDFRDPKEWEWAELNAFHSADVAKQILQDIDKAISDAEYLVKKQQGELEDNKFRSMFSKLLKKEELDV